MKSIRDWERSIRDLERSFADVADTLGKLAKDLEQIYIDRNEADLMERNRKIEELLKQAKRYEAEKRHLPHQNRTRFNEMKKDE